MRLIQSATGGAAATVLQTHSQSQYNYTSMREDDIELAIKVVSCPAGCVNVNLFHSDDEWLKCVHGEKPACYQPKDRIDMCSLFSHRLVRNFTFENFCRNRFVHEPVFYATWNFVS